MMFLFCHAKQGGGSTLTEAEQFALRSGLGEFARVARIARPGALYGA